MYISPPKKTLSETFEEISKSPSLIPELGEFLIANTPHGSSVATCDELNRLLTGIKLAAKVVNRELSKAGLADILGAAGIENVQGEQQQKLDVFANDKFIQALANREVVCGICSEELDEFIPVNPNSKYLILMDPLDGSSNIDVNVSVGTIFSILRRKTPVGTMPEISDFLQPGRSQLCAGYVLYGSSTQLVVTTGNGVQGFTLDPSLGTFYLSHPELKFPSSASVYSCNEGNWLAFPKGVKEFIDWCHDDEKGMRRPLSLRYIGSLVSDFHRNLLQGGIYLYPPTKKDRRGKLRLLYEANPMAMIAEQAGGMAVDGFNPILDIQPSSLHERVPLFTGSKVLVGQLMKMMKELSPEENMGLNPGIEK
eukprot:Cvel_3063.t1-p1 / transcript=Cvel_3063.t1 / gene=Cvel_3063 / organism=Chromera_velia_CCMP2878 / gene_product=Fructose-1,6-bisphosphatase class 1, putative / transcript_product=Fructose-1,6-bisphosphatase class 1, putative / location=Cvel_scaffold122:69252-73365(+) / protein_length=366 / sequence_SO=supercontig / SO=protein_coding / is_pseudo=false